MATQAAGGGHVEVPPAVFPLAWLNEVVGADNRAVMGGTAAMYAGLPLAHDVKACTVNTLPIVHAYDVPRFEWCIATLARTGFGVTRMDARTVLLCNESSGGLVVVRLTNGLEWASGPTGEGSLQCMMMAGVADCVSVSNGYELNCMRQLSKMTFSPRLAYAAELVLQESERIGGADVEEIDFRDILKKPILRVDGPAAVAEVKSVDEAAIGAGRVEEIRAAVDEAAIEAGRVEEIRAAVDEAAIEAGRVEEIRAAVDEAAIKAERIEEIQRDVDATQIKKAYIARIRRDIRTAPIVAARTKEIARSVDVEHIDRLRMQIFMLETTARKQSKAGEHIKELQERNARLTATVETMDAKLSSMRETYRILRDRAKETSRLLGRKESRSIQLKKTLDAVRAELDKKNAEMKKLGARSTELKRVHALEVEVLRLQKIESSTSEIVAEAERQRRGAALVADTMRMRHAELKAREAELKAREAELKAREVGVAQAYGSIVEMMSPETTPPTVVAKLLKLKFVLNMQQQVAHYAIPRDDESLRRLRDIITEHARKGDFMASVGLLEMERGGISVEEGSGVRGAAAIVATMCAQARAELIRIMGVSLPASSKKDVARLLFVGDSSSTESFYHFFPLSLRLVKMREQRGQIEVMDDNVDPDSARCGADPRDPSLYVGFLRIDGNTGASIVDPTVEGVNEACMVLQQQAAMLLAYFFSSALDVVSRSSNMAQHIIAEIVNATCSEAAKRALPIPPHLAARVAEEEEEKKQKSASAPPLSSVVLPSGRSLVAMAFPDVPDDERTVDMYKAILTSRVDEEIAPMPLDRSVVLTLPDGGRRNFIRPGLAYDTLEALSRQHEAERIRLIVRLANAREAESGFVTAAIGGGLDKLVAAAVEEAAGGAGGGACRVSGEKKAKGKRGKKGRGKGKGRA